jgi:hypothetical protein
MLDGLAAHRARGHGCTAVAVSSRRKKMAINNSTAI